MASAVVTTSKTTRLIVDLSDAEVIALRAMMQNGRSEKSDYAESVRFAIFNALKDK